MNLREGTIDIGASGHSLDVTQDMPGGRTRLNPDLAPHVACWLLTLKLQYERQSTMTLRGLKGAERDRRKRQIAWARERCSAIDEIVRRLPETAETGAHMSVVSEWERGLAPTAGGSNGD